MSDDEIAKRIAQQCCIIVLLQALGRKERAQMFTNHVLRLVYTHRVAIERWLESRKPKTT